MSKTVFILDDDDAHRRLIRRALEKLDEAFTYIEADSLAASRAVFFAPTPPDPSPELAVLDLNLGDGKSTELIREREPADFLHVVVSGLVEMLASHRDRQTTIELVRPVGVFILAAVLRDQVYLQTARTLRDTRIVMIPSESVRAAMAADNSFMSAIVGELAKGYRSVVKDLKNQKLRSGTERLANWILATSDRHGGRPDVDIDVEKRVLAARLGMTPENLSRAFRTLSQHGVEVTRRTVRIIDRDQISSFATPDPLIDDQST